MVNKFYSATREIKPSYKRMGKLFSNRVNERLTNEIDSRLRTRLRMIIWKMWKVPSKRQWGLQKLASIKT